MPLSFNGWLTAPSSSGQKDCVQFNAQKGWMDNNCEIIQPFVCKALRPGGRNSLLLNEQLSEFSTDLQDPGL